MQRDIHSRRRYGHRTAGGRSDRTEIERKSITAAAQDDLGQQESGVTFGNADVLISYKIERYSMFYAIFKKATQCVANRKDENTGYFQHFLCKIERYSMFYAIFKKSHAVRGQSER
jgi:hypothetical protein